MAAPESARVLHRDAFKRFSAGNRSLKYLAEYMEERSRLEMEYSVNLQELSTRWNRRISCELRGVIARKHRSNLRTRVKEHIEDCKASKYFEYHNFRPVLRELFSEPTDKGALHNKVANKILHEATVLKKQSKDHFKREAQAAIVNKYIGAVEKQLKLEEKTKKSKKRYYRKKHALEVVQKSMDEFPYRSESSEKYQELQKKRTELTDQASDSYLRYESRLRVETLNRPGFIQEMEHCEAAYNDHEQHRLQSVRDKIVGMLRDLEILEGKDREPCQQTLVKLKTTIKEFPIKNAVNAYTELFVKEHTFPKFEDYQSHSDLKNNTSVGTIECDHNLHGAESSREVVTGLSSTTHTDREISSQPGFASPTKSPVMAWEHPGSDEGSVEEDVADVDVGGDDESEKADGNVSDLTNVRVVAIRAYRGKRSDELSFDVGQVIKQKIPANKQGWAYGWIRPNNFSKRRYGTYPAYCVKARPSKHKKQ